MRSIRARLLAGTLGCSCLLMFVLGVGLEYSIRSILTAGFDEALTAKARALSALVEDEDGEIEAEFANYPSPEFLPGQECEYYVLRTASGQVLARSPSLGEGNPVLGSPLGNADATGVWRATLPDGRPGRYAAMQFEPRYEGRRRSGQLLVLVLGQDTLDLDLALGRMRITLLAVGGAGVLAMCVVMTAVVRKGLRPLKAVGDKIESLNESNLSQRLPIEDVPSEMAPVVRRLNGLLAKLESAFNRERSFTADVAHDLRTPLAGLRSTLEVALSRQRESPDYREAMTECLAVTRDMQSMTHNLLTLARAEAAQLRIQPKDVDVQALLSSLWRRFAAQADERGLRTDFVGPKVAKVSTDSGQLTLVVSQLFDNAVTYAEERGEIRISVEPTGDHTRVRVGNSARHLCPEDAGQVFERYWRADHSRHQPGLHCGVGLSLAKRITELLGGNIRAEVAGGWFEIILDLPSPGSTHNVNAAAGSGVRPLN